MRLGRFALASYLAAVALTGVADRAGADTYDVTNANDSGAGSLREAILQADASAGGTINITAGGPIFLTSALPIISAPLTINGGNRTVTGQGFYRVFFVDVAGRGAVAINDMTIAAGLAQGGNGGLGGGGGLGAGGGLFINRGNVTTSNVTFNGSAAIGGNGGVGGGYGGGGGLGGAGGHGDTLLAGGGGYGGAGGNGSIGGGSGGGGGLDTNGENGGFAGGRGGGEGGLGPAFGGGAGNLYAGGGGGSLAAPGAGGGANGGDGGRFGGGGGGAEVLLPFDGGNGGEFGGGGAGGRGGAGGFGGGGAAGFFTGGSGGFGAGGGGSDTVEAFGNGGAFAGNGGATTSITTRQNQFNTGGGGAALGAGVFVRGGASFTMLDTALDRGVLVPGMGSGSATGGVAGQTAGESLFLAGLTTLSVSAGKTRTIGGSIADVGPYSNNPTAGGFEYATLIKTGGGGLILGQPNSYRGGTVISQGTISADVQASTPLGTGPVTFNDADTGSSDNSLLVGFINTDTFANPIVIANAGTGTSTLNSIPVAAQPMIFSGSVTLNKNLRVRAQNWNPLSALDEPGQTRFDGVISGPGGMTITGGRMVQFRTAAKTYAGPTIVTGNSMLSLYDNASTPMNSTVQIDAGSTVVLEGLSAAVIGGLAGAGTLAHNPNPNPTSTLEVGRNNADTAFTGQITGAVILTKAGAGILDFGPQDNTIFTLTIAGGRVRLTGDQHLQNLHVNDADPGTQALDLNGHTMRFNAFTFLMIALEDRLNRQIGTSADGVYDSTAASKPGTRIGITYVPGAGNTLTMKLTLAGDANLDGKVDFKDLVTLAQNYNSSAGSLYWDNGDFTYDQKVDFNDLVLLAQNYNGTLPTDPIDGAPEGFQGDLVAAFALAPEPAILPLLAGLALMARRRRSRV